MFKICIKNNNKTSCVMKYITDFQNLFVFLKYDTQHVTSKESCDTVNI